MAVFVIVRCKHAHTVDSRYHRARPYCRVIEYSAVAERNFYRNSRTGEACWSMPPQVRFYIPPRLEDKVRSRACTSDRRWLYS
jgi:hypothetical protein